MKKVKQFRKQGRKIYYTDETWVNKRHMVKKEWQDANVKNVQRATIKGWSVGLKMPHAKMPTRDEFQSIREVIWRYS